MMGVVVCSREAHSLVDYWDLAANKFMHKCSKTGAGAQQSSSRGHGSLVHTLQDSSVPAEQLKFWLSCFCGSAWGLCWRIKNC